MIQKLFVARWQTLACSWNQKTRSNSQSNQAQQVVSGRVPELDGIRGLAISLVVFWHFFPGMTPTIPGSLLAYLVRLTWIGWTGVNLFFVLSGFLIGGILLDNKCASNYFKVFYVRRFCRILPLYYAWLTLFYILKPLLPSLEWLFGDPLTAWSYLTYTQNFALTFRHEVSANWLSVTWSLAVEEQFYLILPLVIRVTSVRLVPKMVCALALVAPVYRVVQYYYWSEFPVLLPTHMDDLAFGVLGSYLVRYFPGILTPRRLFAVLVLSGLGLVAFTYAPSPVALATYGYSCLALFYTSALLVTVCRRHGLLARAFNLNWLRKLGTLAYGIYIFHMGVLGLIHGFLFAQKPEIVGWASLLATILALLVTIFAAHFSWQYFEKPILRLGHSLSYSGPSEELAIVATDQQRGFVT